MYLPPYFRHLLSSQHYAVFVLYVVSLTAFVDRCWSKLADEISTTFSAINYFALNDLSFLGDWPDWYSVLCLLLLYPIASAGILMQLLRLLKAKQRRWAAYLCWLVFGTTMTLLGTTETQFYGLLLSYFCVAAWQFDRYMTLTGLFYLSAAVFSLSNLIMCLSWLAS